MKRILLLLLGVVLVCGVQAQVCDNGLSVVASGYHSFKTTDYAYHNKTWDAALGVNYSFHFSERFYLLPEASVFIKKYRDADADKLGGGLMVGGDAVYCLGLHQCKTSFELFTGPRLDCEFIRARSVYDGSADTYPYSNMFQLYWRAGIAHSVERIRLSVAVSMPVTTYASGERMWGIDFAIAYKLPI